MTKSRRAVIDVGSSTAKFAIYDWSLGKAQVYLESDDVATGLGKGLKVGGKLPAEGKRATLAAISDFVARIESAGASLDLLAATEAVRRAADGEVFLDELRARLGEATDVRCIDAETEAKWALRSAQESLELPERPLLSIDTGGSSHDFAMLDSNPGRGGADDWVSLPFGMIQLMEIAPPQAAAGRLGAQQVDDLSTFLRREFHKLRVCMKRGRGLPQRIVGTSGAILSLATVDAELGPSSKQERARLVHGRIIQRLTIDSMIAVAAEMSAAERRLMMPSLTELRAPIFVHGALIYRELLEVMELDEVTVNARGMKLGGLHELQDARKP
ncbi:MAG: hypothetical protein V3W41_00875 [Planctomycetota bacterium]